MSNNRVISVMLSVYNREHYLRNCLDSVLAQKNVRTEIIIVDDGSTDGSAAICDEYALQHDNIKVIHQKNQGISIARNVAIDAARGDFLFFLDSDDFLPEDSLETLLKLQAEYDADCVMGNYACYNDDFTYDKVIRVPEEYENKLLSNREICELLLFSDKTHLLIVSWAKLFKKEVWDGIRFPQQITKSEDQYIFPALIENMPRVYFTGKVVYNQVFSKVSISRSKFTIKHLYHAEGILIVMDYLMKKGYYDIALFKFGLGTRHLIYMKKRLKDRKSRKMVKDLYRRYCLMSRRLQPHFGKLILFRMILFRINLDLYDIVRRALTKR